MAHLLLSLVFLALLGVGFRSIWHDLTRPLVMQPWDDEAMMLAPAPVRVAAGPALAAPVRLNPVSSTSAAPRPVANGWFAFAA